MLESVNNERSVPALNRTLKKATKQPWWVIVIAAIIPPTVSSFFTYRAAVVEAKMKTDEAKAGAEAGYEATRKAVEELLKRDNEYGKAIAGLGGHVDSIERFLILSNRPESKLPRAVLHLPPTVSTKEVKKAGNTKVDMPMDLDTALYYAKTGQFSKLGKVYEGPAEDAPIWTFTSPAESTPKK